MFPLLTNQKLHYYIFYTVTYDCQKVDIMSHLKTFFKVAPPGILCLICVPFSIEQKRSQLL